MWDSALWFFAELIGVSPGEIQSMMTLGKSQLPGGACRLRKSEGVAVILVCAVVTSQLGVV